MPIWLGRILDDVLPEAVGKIENRRVLHWLFWPTTALLGLLFTATNGVLGAVMVGVPLLLAGLTWKIGLAWVPTPLLVLAGAAVVFPAFFLNAFKQGDGPANAVGWIVMVVFVVWLGTYPTMLGTLNRQFLERRYPEGEIEDQTGSLRVFLVKSWIAVVTMQLVGDGLATAVCVIALWHRRPWSAVAAGLVCLISPVLSLGNDDVWFTINLDPWEMGVAAIAAWPWFQAARHPSWDKHRVSV